MFYFTKIIFFIYSFEYIKIYNNKYSIFETVTNIKGNDKLVYLKDNYLVDSKSKSNDNLSKKQEI